MAAPRQPFVVLVLMACAAGAGLCILEHRPPESVELRVRELVHIRGGQTVLVLQEAAGSRWLPIPVTRAEAATIERQLHSPGGLASEAVDAYLMGESDLPAPVKPSALPLSVV